jgi:hypothetical protein
MADRLQQQIIGVTQKAGILYPRIGRIQRSALHELAIILSSSVRIGGIGAGRIIVKAGKFADRRALREIILGVAMTTATNAEIFLL